jgi:hypothetical protein
MKNRLLLGFATIAVLSIAVFFFGCPSGKKSVVESDAAEKVYVAPGKYDEFMPSFRVALVDRFQCMVFRAVGYCGLSPFSRKIPRMGMVIPKKQKLC